MKVNRYPYKVKTILIYPEPISSSVIILNSVKNMKHSHEHSHAQILVAFPQTETLRHIN